MYNFMKKEPVKPVMSEHLKHVKIPQPMEINFDSKTDHMASMIANMSARVVDMADEVICNAIIKFAEEEGITDLYLIDKKFIKRAIIGEMNSMRFRELMQLPESEIKKIRVVDEDEYDKMKADLNEYLVWKNAFPISLVKILSML